MATFVSATEAAAIVCDKDRVMLGGFSNAGYAGEIVKALCENSTATDLSIIVNSANELTRVPLEQILATRCAHMTCTFIRGSKAASRLYDEGRVTLLPQGTFAESLRAAGAGIPAYYTPVGYGTAIAQGKQTREFDGRGCLLEQAMHGDICFFRASVVDESGNCYLRRASRNFSGLMAMACSRVYVEAERVVKTGEIDPDLVMVPNIAIDGIVKVGDINVDR